jgi:hypothetical protein
MRNGIADCLVTVFDQFIPTMFTASSSSSSSSSSSAQTILPSIASPITSHILKSLEKSCLLLRELCIHNDNRSEMSSSFDNGKYFIKQSALIPNLILLIHQYQSFPLLSSNALLAMKAMITTNEAVQIISLHGIIELLSNILSSYTQIILQLSQQSSNNSSVKPLDETNIEKLKINENEQQLPAGTEQKEVEEDENEIDEMNKEFEEGSANGLDNSQHSSASTTSISSSSTSPLLLLRAIIALIRNIIADDKKKDQFVFCGALQSLLVIFLSSQKTSSSSSSSTWDIGNDYYLIEHLFGCFAQFALRSPKNSLLIMSENYSLFLPLMIFYMRKYSSSDSLHRQICLMLHNIINRCPEFKNIFLDYHLEDVLRNISGRLPTVKDESYVLLRDLGINIQYVKLDEDSGKFVPVYEAFGSQANKNFRPVYDDATNYIETRIQEEARPPLAPPVTVDVDEESDHSHKHDHSHSEHDHHHDHQEGGSCCSVDEHSHDHNHQHTD